MSIRISLLIILSCFIGTFSPAQAHALELISLKTRPGETQTFILIKTDNPVASVILFVGGHGNLKLSSVSGIPDIGWGKNNFLVRTRNAFAEHGLMVAVVDAPSDKKGKKGMLGGFRNSEEHVTDIDAVIAYLRKEAPVPVWLVGTSRGTESAARVAISSHEKPDGLILTSSMTESNKGGSAVTELALSNIKIPTMIIAHREDMCRHTPSKGAEEIKRKLTSAPRIEVSYFTGGDTPRSDPCKALSAHGFLGIEDEVVKDIVHFIQRD
jgi:pimeloyl-ACP methyl ester carboxylesterase